MASNGARQPLARSEAEGESAARALGGVSEIKCEVKLGPSPLNPSHQKLTTLDSETIVANLMGSVKEAFKLLRSSAVTPRATEQAPQTYTGTFPLTTFSINSGRGGKPTP